MSFDAAAYDAFYRLSVDDPQSFWATQAKRIDWHQPFSKTLDYDEPPFAKWFVGGETNLCYNAVDRHLATRADQAALVAISTETDTAVSYTHLTLPTTSRV